MSYARIFPPFDDDRFDRMVARFMLGERGRAELARLESAGSARAYGFAFNSLACLLVLVLADADTFGGFVYLAALAYCVREMLFAVRTTLLLRLALSLEPRVS